MDWNSEHFEMRWQGRTTPLGFFLLTTQFFFFSLSIFISDPTSFLHWMCVCVCVTPISYVQLWWSCFSSPSSGLGDVMGRGDSEIEMGLGFSATTVNCTFLGTQGLTGRERDALRKAACYHGASSFSVGFSVGERLRISRGRDGRGGMRRQTMEFPCGIQL